MPVKILPGQQIKLLPYIEPKFCQTGEDRCFLHQPLDPFRMQFQQTPFNNFSCDPFFSLSGPNVLTNGAFAGSATGWTLTDATYGSDKVCFDGTLTAQIFQSGVVLDSTKLYKVTIEVSGMTTGTVKVVVGGSLLISDITEDGLYTRYGVIGATDEVYIYTDDSSDACIENISVQIAFDCWEFDNSDFYLTFNEDTFGSKVTHIPGSATTFTVPDALVQGNNYQARIRIQGRTQGYVQMFAGDLDNVSTPITQNGIFTQYLTANQTGTATGDPVDFYFVMDADFDGTIEYVYSYGLRNDFICTLLAEDGTPVADLSSKLEYTKDFVTLLFTGLNSITGFDGPIDYGCYRISITDPDSNGFVVNGDFTVNSDWFGSCYFTSWFDSGQATGVADGTPCTPTELVQANSLGLVTGKYYVASFKYKSNFVDPGNDIRFDVCGTTVGNVSPTTSFQVFTSSPFQISNPLSQIRFHFDYGDITNGNSTTIDSVNIYELNQYVSNCINYKQEHPGTYLVIGRSNFIESGIHGGAYGFGFLFQPRNLYVFFLIQRLALGFRKPKHPSKFSDGVYSIGKHYKSFASSEKVYEVVFEPTGEIQHDTIALMIQCPSFYIQGNNGIAISEDSRYHCINEEYAPVYDETDSTKLAPSVIQVQHIKDIQKISNVY